MTYQTSYAYRLGLAFAAIFTFFTPLCQAQYAATPVTEPLVIDGRLSEPAWQQATVFGDFKFLSSYTKGSPTAQTSFRVLVDENTVSIGVLCEEPRMSELKAAPLQRDTDIFGEDCIEFFMDPAGTGDTYYQFAVSANNDQWDGGWIERGNTGMEDYSTVWESAVHKGADFWSLEIRIPLSAFYNTRTDNFSDAWKLNVTRQRKSVSELTSWSPLVGGFHEPGNWRHVANMPHKSSSSDMAVLAVQALTQSADEAGCRGRVRIETFASQQAAGTYTVAISADGVPIITNALLHIAAGYAESVIDDLLFPTEGRVNLQLEFRRADGTPALGVIRSARVNYRPFVFTLDEPFYAACIFDGQDVPEIRGSLVAHLPSDILKDGGVTLTFTGPGIVEPVTQTLVFENGRAPFAFDATHLQVGQAKLSANAMKAGQMIADGEQEIRKLPPNTDGSTVIVNRDLNLVANGRPLLYRGWYGSGAWMVSQVHQQRWPTEYDAFPATDMGKQIDLQPERLDPSDAANVQFDVKPSQKVMDAIRESVIAGRNDPDLWWYYLSDEPECRYVSPVYLKYAYDLIKELDPYHPVLIISRAPDLYTESADILCPHPYIGPVVINGKRTLSQPMQSIRRQIRTVMNAGEGKILPWLCPQAFSYAFALDGADSPTFDESRCMIWSAVANGCKGFHPYLYHAAQDSPDLLYGYRMFYESLARLEPIIIGSSKPEPVHVEAPEDGVDVMIKKEGDHLLVIVANLLDKPCVATVQSPALKDIVELDCFRESGSVTVDNSTIKLTLAPYGVTILTYPALDDGLESLETVRSHIADANAACIRPGNVLYKRDRDIDGSSSSTYMTMKGVVNTLTDGLRDNVGWRHINGVQPPWVELTFSTFVPNIRTLKVFGNRLQGMTVDYWQDDAWQPLGTAPVNAVNEATFSLDKPVSSTKLRFTLPNSKAGHVDAGELYEVEIYE